MDLTTLAINHMTMANTSFATLLRVAKETSCDAVVVRADLDGPLFDGLNADVAGTLAREHGLRILALAEIGAFNNLTAKRLEATEQLARIAAACGAESIVLIPRNDGHLTSPATRASDLRSALGEIRPILDAHGVIGEPLILVSHNMRQVFDLVDRIIVFRRGRIVANLRKEETDGQDVVAYITGAKTGEEYLGAA